MKFIPYADLRPGDRVEIDTHADELAVVEVLREAEDTLDIFGRPIKRLWCRSNDREGFISYGEGGGFRGRVIA